MKKIITAAMFTLLALPTVTNAADMKPYVGIGVGLFAIGLNINDPLVGSATQRNSTWGSFIKAGVDVNDYFGGELRIGTTGKPSTDWGPGLPVGSGFITTVSSNVSTKVDYFISYLGKIQYPASDSYKIYGLLGGTTAKYSTSLSLAGLNVDSNKTKTGFTYGAGMEVNLNDSTSIGIEWVEYWTNVTIDNIGGTQEGSFRGLSTTLNMTF